MIETIHLDLPALGATLSRRLRDAGVPVTPERAVAFAQALELVRPVSRTRLYWTARAVFVSDESHAMAFDSVFFSVFGGAVAVERPQPDTPPAVRDSLGQQADSKSSAGEEEAELDVPLPIASDEEVLASKSFAALEPEELARLYRLMSRLELATPLRQTRRYERGHHGRWIDMRRTLRGSLRTGGDPIRLACRNRRIVPRRLVMLCDISGSMEPYARAYLQFLTCASAAGPNAEAFVFATRLTRITGARGSAPGARDRACRRGRAGLVERHPHRGCAEDVQRPPRAPRHGPWGGGGDPLRRLGARRTGSGGP